jgi:hypothetical protein
MAQVEVRLKRLAADRFIFGQVNFVDANDGPQVVSLGGDEVTVNQFHNASLCSVPEYHDLIAHGDDVRKADIVRAERPAQAAKHISTRSQTSVDGAAFHLAVGDRHFTAQAVAHPGRARLFLHEYRSAVADSGIERHSSTRAEHDHRNHQNHH